MRLVLFLAAFMAYAGAAFAETEFKTLFDGKSLDGWKTQNSAADTFKLKDGVLHVEGNSGWLRSAEQYGDFQLQVEVRFLTDNADSGVFVRAVGDSIFMRGWPGSSYQVQARDVTRNKSANPLLIGNIYRHGNRGGETTFDSQAAFQAAKATGEWQTFDIEVRGDTIKVTLNGTVLTQATGLANPRGYIGLQGEAGVVEYRAVRIREIQKD
ncbi:MAG TPA: DUF1080 domain-containing protein [Terriglobia bacterium]|nr:DUF1080 domain-containing protein [Terriglobia bacterium]